MIEFWFPNGFDLKHTDFIVNDGVEGINIFIEKKIHKYIGLPEISTVKE
jgi:hypothetical protein